MTAKENFLSENEIRSHLSHNILLRILDITDSTNNVVKQLTLEDAPHGTTVIALQQEKGRGRLGRSFHAPAGTGIYMSILIRPGSESGGPVLITTAAAVAVCRAISEVCGIEAGIKWVNDIHIDGKKVCGILAEAISDPESGQISGIVVGIGINCSVEGFPEELREIAGAVDGDYSPSQLAASVISNMLAVTDDIESRSFMDEYRRRSVITNTHIHVYKGGFSPDKPGKAAYVLGIDDNGGLQVLYSSGEQETLTSGEISIRRNHD